MDSGEGVCVDPGEKEAILEARKGKRRAVGFRQRRRIDIVGWLKTLETGSPHLQQTFMHRVSVIVHCVAVTVYSITRTGVVFHCTYYLFQENKSLGTDHHLHSSSNVWEVVLSTGSTYIQWTLFRAKIA
jgi:hypothetical protein